MSWLNLLGIAVGLAMDAFARGLKNAAAILKDGRMPDAIKQRYAGWDTGIGADIEAGKADFKSLEAFTLENGEPEPQSGRQEKMENILNEFI